VGIGLAVDQVASRCIQKPPEWDRQQGADHRRHQVDPEGPDIAGDQAGPALRAGFIDAPETGPVNSAATAI